MCASPRHYYIERLPSVSDPTSSLIQFHQSKMSKQEPSMNLFQRSDSDAFRDRLNDWDNDVKLKSKPGGSNDNPFVNDDLEFGETPRSNRSSYFTRSNSNRQLFDSTAAIKNDSVIKPKPMFKTPSMRKLNTNFIFNKPSLPSPHMGFGNNVESPRTRSGLNNLNFSFE